MLDAVKKAATPLKSVGLYLVVYDGWRSLDVQERLFWKYLQMFTVKNTTYEMLFADAHSVSELKNVFDRLPKDAQVFLREANRKYVSWPSSDPQKPSPHATGGSVDVWIMDVFGDPINMGVPFDWMEPDAGAFYHLKVKRRKFKGNDWAVSNHRTNLILAMVDACFTCYGPEFWHFNMGNQMDSIVSGKTARFSYVEPSV